jgi:hypothetical protein
MHYVYSPNGKKVSNHMMKDCRTFLWLQGAFGAKHAEARTQGYTEPWVSSIQHTSASSIVSQRSHTNSGAAEHQ